MATILAALFEILNRPSMADVLVELFLFLVPLWLAVLVGLLVGWVWKPKWAKLGGESREEIIISSSSSLLSNSDPQLLGFGFDSIPSLASLKALLESCISWVSDDKMEKVEISEINLDCSSLQLENENLVVSGKDLEHLCKLVEGNDGGLQWKQMMDRSTETIIYQAWRRDPEDGPPQYRSRTVFEDATPELVRDFFWDDEFRSQWDDMLIHSTTVEECTQTGTMIVHWIRKFPFFCSDREYTIGRRIWDLGRSFYCVTKGVPCPSVPRRNKLRRVDLYYSSWCIRAVESKRGDGQLTACEVLLFHHEEMGIPWNVAKWGVQLGMWDTVKKIEPGLRAYQIACRSGAPLSPSASMAHINTKINPDYLASLEDDDSSENQTLNSEKPWQQNIPKALVIGGAIALACSIDRGLLTKAIIFGVARRFGRKL